MTEKPEWFRETPHMMPDPKFLKPVKGYLDPRPPINHDISLTDLLSGSEASIDPQLLAKADSVDF